MSDDQKKSNVRQVGFRYNKEEHQSLENWINAQKNIGLSVVYALERAILAYGSDADIIETVLNDEQNNKVVRGELE